MSSQRPPGACSPLGPRMVGAPRTCTERTRGRGQLSASRTCPGRRGCLCLQPELPTAHAAGASPEHPLGKPAPVWPSPAPPEGRSLTQTLVTVQTASSTGRTRGQPCGQEPPLQEETTQLGRVTTDSFSKPLGAGSRVQA